MNKFKIIKLVTVLVFLALILFTSMYNKLSFKNQNKSLQLINYNFEDRVCVLGDNNLFVGDSKAQIENNYWDFKFTKISENNIELRINKLWYGEYNDTILDIDYLNKLCLYIEEIAKASNVDLGNIDLIAKKIQDDYLNVKNQEENINKILEYSITLNKAMLSLERVRLSE